ncbi:translocation protein Sec62-domain-containing protein [Gorgonomyces haynaldii]|nr:translocation protein Sec62-domain-containing protein [Gorgonomyces haynaldii]
MSATKLPADIQQIVDYLYSKSESQLRIREGILNGKRADYFKGKHAVNALLREPYKKKQRPSIPDRETGERYMSQLLTHGVIVRVHKEPKQTQLQLVNEQVFDPEGYYIWLYQGSPLTGILIAAGVLLVIFAGVLFPLWPPFMRQGGYYVSLLLMGFLGFLMALGVIRIVIWLGLKITIGRGGWLFPNLFADVGVIESFFPLWIWEDEPRKKKKKQ